MPPETIAGRYRVEREIGRGGMGSVWLCRDELLGRRVAAKQVGRLPGESTPDLARAMREARSSAALNHRNVVSIYDAVEEHDHIWLVMEYVAGRTLSQIMAEDGPLPAERAARIGAQVADGLAAAHARGTVHRDVKPGNILVTDDDQAKISDFGISRTTGDPTLTQTGLVIGTPAYFSPGLARGAEPSAADDVWALGATLYAAVEGRPPYPEQRNAIAMLTTIAADRPPAPERAGFLADPIGRMLDPDPASRWSMADVAHSLHRGGATPVKPVETPVADKPAEPADPAERPRRRRGAVLVAVAVALLVLVAGTGYLLSDAGDGSATPEAGQTPGGSGDTGTTESPSPISGGSEGSTTEGSTTASGTGSPMAFVDGYYGVLPDDTRSGWELLSPEFQGEVGSYGDYDGFWSTIDSVAVEGTEAAGPDAVDVTLTYTTSDGGTDREVRRIWVEQTGDGYLITDDAIVG